MAIPFEAALRGALARAARVAVIGIGDEYSPVDRLGMDAAEFLRARPLPEIRVFPAGTVPEAVTAPVRRFRPDHILLLDAVEMGEEPGTAAVISPDRVQGSLLSTHALPLPVLMEYMARDSGAGISLIGFQPDLIRPGLSEQGRVTLEGNLQVLHAVLSSLSVQGRKKIGRCVRE